LPVLPISPLPPTINSHPLHDREQVLPWYSLLLTTISMPPLSSTPPKPSSTQTSVHPRASSPLGLGVVFGIVICSIVFTILVILFLCWVYASHYKTPASTLRYPYISYSCFSSRYNLPQRHLSHNTSWAVPLPLRSHSSVSFDSSGTWRRWYRDGDWRRGRGAMWRPREGYYDRENRLGYSHLHRGLLNGG
jgi:hypothetical protein